MSAEEYLKRLDSKADAMSETLLQVRVDLNDHMRRTKAAEENIALLREEMTPLKGHVAAWAGVSKAFSVLVAVAGVALAIWKLVL